VFNQVSLIPKTLPQLPYLPIMTTIALPSGASIITEGNEYESGFDNRVLDITGDEIVAVSAPEFAEDPKGAMRRLLDGIARVEPNISVVPGEYAFKIRKGLYVIGSPEGVYLTRQTPRSYVEKYDEDKEILCYACEEWEAEPESCIGAFLNAAHSGAKW